MPVRGIDTPQATLMELLLSGNQRQGYYVHALLDPGGRVSEPIKLNRQDPQLLALVARVQQRTAKEDDLHKLGALLFSALCSGQVGLAFYEARAAVRAEGASLRLALTIEPVELTELPWEFMYDPRLNQHLVLLPEVRFARNMVTPSAVNKLETPAPLRVLVGYSSPASYNGASLWPLNTDGEMQLIQRVLSPLVSAGQLQIYALQARSPADLAAALQTYKPHVFHFIGHSDVLNGIPLIMLGPTRGAGVPLYGEKLSSLLNNDPALQLVVLNSCMSVQANVNRALHGLVPAIAAAGVPAVVGWQTSISDASAPQMAARLYQQLASGATVDDAMTATRLSLNVDPQVEPLAWGLSVLYMRNRGARIIAEQKKGARMLVIDDERARADLIKSRFSSRGLQVEWANGGDAGLKSAAANPPDVIVLDLKMPGMDGMEVLRRLKANPITKKTPVLVLTVLGYDYDVALDAYISGAQYVIPYNGRIDQLEQVLRGNLKIPLN